MAITRLERKGRKNKTVSKKRTSAIKRLSATPVVKNVDVEAIKAEFEKAANAKKPAAKKAEKPVEKEELPVEAVEKKAAVKEVKAEAAPEKVKKEVKKKAPAKKKEKE